MKDLLSSICDIILYLAVFRMWFLTQDLKREIAELRDDQDDDDADGGDGAGNGPKTPFGIDRSDPGDWWKHGH